MDLLTAHIFVVPLGESPGMYNDNRRGPAPAGGAGRTEVGSDWHLCHKELKFSRGQKA